MIALKKIKVRSKLIHKSETGQAQVEFTLTFLFVLLLIFGIIEMIIFIYTYTVLANSAKEGVRYAIVHGCDRGASACSGSCTLACTDTTGANVVTQVKNWAKLSLHDTTAMTVTVTYPDSTSDAPNRVRVTISYPYQPLFGFSWPRVTVHAAAEGRIAY